MESCFGQLSDHLIGSDQSLCWPRTLEFSLSSYVLVIFIQRFEVTGLTHRPSPSTAVAWADTAALQQEASQAAPNQLAILQSISRPQYRTTY